MQPAPQLSRSRSLRGMPSFWGLRIEPALTYPAGHPFGNQVVDRFTGCNPGADVATGDRERGDLDEGDHTLGQSRIGEVMSGPGDAHQMRAIHDAVGVVPADDLGEGIGTGDEEPFGALTRVRCFEAALQIAQGIDGVGRAFPIDVDTRDLEASIGRGRDNGHQVPILTGGGGALLVPRLPGRGEDDPPQVEPMGDLGSGDQVAVMDGVEGATHDADAAVRQRSTLIIKVTTNKPIKIAKATSPKTHAGVEASPAASAATSCEASAASESFMSPTLPASAAACPSRGCVRRRSRRRWWR